VCVVEPGRRRAHRVGETIPPDTRLVLQALGVWESFANEGHEPCLGSSSAWGSNSIGYNDFVLNPYGSGWHLDRVRFDTWLARQAVAAGVAWWPAVRLIGSRPARNGYELRVEDRRAGGSTHTLRARFVVDATGSAAAFARTVGAKRVEHDHLSVVCGFFDATEASSASRLTLLEAVQDGWWYAAGLPGRRLALAFATDADVVRARRLTQPSRFLTQALQTNHIAARLDGYRFVPDELVVRAATSSILCPTAGPDWLAVGDATATYDPIASQGIHKALAGGITAATTVAALLRTGTPVPVGSPYAHEVERAFEEYLTNRNYLYTLEQRWPTSPFWQRRHAHRQPTG
jgi:flavin-dependent dehydrogenase